MAAGKVNARVVSVGMTFSACIEQDEIATVEMSFPMRETWTIADVEFLANSIRGYLESKLVGSCRCVISDPEDRRPDGG